MFEFPKQLDDNDFRMFQYYTIDKIVSKSCRLKDLSPIFWDSIFKDEFRLDASSTYFFPVTLTHFPVTLTLIFQ